MLKEYGCDTEFSWIELSKDVVGVICPIVVAYTSMITPHDEM